MPPPGTEIGVSIGFRSIYDWRSGRAELFPGHFDGGKSGSGPTAVADYDKPKEATVEAWSATVAHLQRFASHRVAFQSCTEEHLSTENELVRNILLALLSSLAKLEREKISQRPKAGLERARANGKRLVGLHSAMAPESETA